MTKKNKKKNKKKKIIIISIILLIVIVIILLPILIHKNNKKENNVKEIKTEEKINKDNKEEIKEDKTTKKEEKDTTEIKEENNQDVEQTQNQNNQEQQNTNNTKKEEYKPTPSPTPTPQPQPTPQPEPTPQPPVITYSCPDGYNLNGTTCTSTTSMISYCPDNTSDYGSNEIPSGTYCVNLSDGYYTEDSCPNGYGIITIISIGAPDKLFCLKLYDKIYTCPDGYTQNGESCTRTIDANQN